MEHRVEVGRSVRMFVIKRKEIPVQQALTVEAEKTHWIPDTYRRESPQDLLMDQMWDVREGLTDNSKVF